MVAQICLLLGNHEAHLHLLQVSREARLLVRGEVEVFRIVATMLHERTLYI